jgi:hypothetical protein
MIKRALKVDDSLLVAVSEERSEPPDWWRSTDSGSTWQPVPEDDPVLGRIKFDPDTGTVSISFI